MARLVAINSIQIPVVSRWCRAVVVRRDQLLRKLHPEAAGCHTQNSFRQNSVNETDASLVFLDG